MSILRIVITLTHYADAAGVKNINIYPFLVIAYQASDKIASEDDRHRLQKILEWPQWEQLARDREIVPFSVAPEYVLGPTAFARLLIVLARRNALSSTQLLHKSPEGLSPTTSLAQILLMTHSNVIKRSVKISGEPKIVHGDSRSSIAYGECAELAMAIVTFSDPTHNPNIKAAYRVRYNLVTNLGDVAQLAFKLKQYRRAYFATLAALDLDVHSDPWEKADAGLIKNYKRVAREAKEVLDSE
ncbi:hypothetical protein CONPUDRAFT_168020 [Coniophora puteana RWD-64-598 SS2]|uniref:Uncharacterized protein n=1 Tax=Coniophora puteana (strain RWD-64-598) TaxID=741705 RepID=A0A5M3MFU0_CONPW|nr:uncharacterized protein CONPUDRAFT_168020 [Coniophora puteana RWD-64-598 SS2]EIW78082.1 hypothetical protein CONPUDRAFT_168020 [Coniophora puteana RWD-64-598 SS2]